jgi:hypothetical protein
MTTLLQEIEELRVQVNELASNEQGLVRALGEALSRADEKLLSDVRRVSTAHEVRREVIFKELQMLASRIGLFPVARETTAALEDSRQAAPAYPEGGDGPVFPRGDWREATNNIQDEFDQQLNGRSAAH